MALFRGILLASRAIYHCIPLKAIQYYTYVVNDIFSRIKLVTYLPHFKHTLNPHFITYYEFKKQVDYYGNKVIYAS